MAENSDSYGDSAAAQGASADPAGSEDPSPTELTDQSSQPAATSDPGLKQKDFDTEWAAVNERLNQITKLRAEQDARVKNQIMPQVEALQKLVNQPDEPIPQLETVPPPPTEQQKGNAYEAVAQMLKFGALLAIAYGISARRGGAVQRFALAGALQGWADSQQQNSANGRRASAQSLQLWEKQREVIKDENKIQLDNYHAVLQDKRLRLQQQMDMIKMIADQYQNYKMSSDAERQDLLAIQKNLVEMKRMDKDWVQQTRKDRPKLETVIGKGDRAHKYEAWVLEQSHGTVHLSDNTPPDEYYAIEDKYKWSDFDKYEAALAEKKSLESKGKHEEAEKIQSEKTPEDQSKDVDKAADLLKDSLPGLVQ